MYSARASAAKSVTPISNDATDSSPRPASPIGGAPTRPSHVHDVIHGRFNSAATIVAPTPVTKNHIAVTHEPRREQGAEREDHRNEEHQRQRDRGERGGDGNGDAGQNCPSDAFAGVEVDQAVGDVDFGELRISGRDPCRATDQMDDPRAIA